MSVDVHHKVTIGNITFGVSFGAVEIRYWHVEWIGRLLRRRASHIDNFDQVVVFKSPTRFLAFSMGRKIIAPRINRREMQVGGR